MKLGLALVLFLSQTGWAQTEPATRSGPDSLLYVWLYDADREAPDFLAVIDADESSEGYGSVLTTVPAGEVRGHAHHTSLTLPYSGILFANDYRGGHTYIYEDRIPHALVLRGSFGKKIIYSFPHSFAELPNGNILATFQSKRDGNLEPGGLVEMTVEGALVQAGDADPRDPRIFLRPYGMVLLPDLDRVVVTTYDMKIADVARHIQIWRLSDLQLLQTLPVPTPEGKEINANPFEGRVLQDGETILFETLSCGLYVLRGLSKDEPQRRPEIRNLHDFEGDFCGVPTRLSTFWIQPVESESEGGLNAVIVLDVSDPDHPAEVDRVRFPDGFGPHWSSPNREGTKIVVTGYGEHLSRRVLMMSFDPKTGALEIDESFGDGDDQGAGLMIDRESWAHGDVGPAIAHGAIFWPSAAPDWKSRPAPGDS